MERDEGEKWLVNLVRDTRMDAKIDLAEVRSLTFVHCFRFTHHTIYRLLASV